ncbi:MAG: ParA family protein [Alcaligenaceae bacterium]
MKVIAIVNQKGGCAKTTTVVNLAAAIAEKGKRVLVIDLDPQGNASQWLGSTGAGANAYDLLMQECDVNSVLTESNVVNVGLIASTRLLAKVERAPVDDIEIETRLKNRLSALSPKKWDFVLIDTPPTLGVLTLNAMNAANFLLIPVTTHVMTLTGVAQLVQLFEEVRDQFNPELSILGLLPSRVDLRTRHAQEILSALNHSFGKLVFKSHIRESVRLAEAPSFQENILLYNPKSTAAKEYRELATEFLKRTQ